MQFEAGMYLGALCDSGVHLLLSACTCPSLPCFTRCWTEPMPEEHVAAMTNAMAGVEESPSEKRKTINDRYEATAGAEGQREEGMEKRSTVPQVLD